MIGSIKRNRAVPLCFLSDLYKVVYDLLSVVDDLNKAGVEVSHDQRVQHAFDVMSEITGKPKPALKIPEPKARDLALEYRQHQNTKYRY